MHNQAIENWEPEGTDQGKPADTFLEPKKMVAKSVQESAASHSQLRLTQQKQKRLVRSALDAGIRPLISEH
jgi:hypothetical protein